jgi:hypothetical protein
MNTNAHLRKTLIQTLLAGILISAAPVKAETETTFRTPAGNMVMIHPNTPLEESEKWIRKNVASDNIDSELLGVRKLIHDQRPIRVRLVLGKTENLCVVFHDKTENGKFSGLPEEFSTMGSQWLIVLHESYHCDDTASLKKVYRLIEQSITENEDQATRDKKIEWGVNQMEVRADVFAAISWLQSGGDIGEVHRLIDIRTKYWSLGDYKHDSTTELLTVILDHQRIRQAWQDDIPRLVQEHAQQKPMNEWLTYREGSLAYAKQFAKLNGYRLSDELKKSSPSKGTAYPPTAAGVAGAWERLSDKAVKLPPLF